MPTELVVCVADAAEARAALDAGADRIEIVRTLRPHSAAEVAEIARVAHGRAPVFAAPDILGDNAPLDAACALAGCGLHGVKLPGGTAAVDTLAAARAVRPSLQGIVTFPLGGDAPDLSSLGRFAEAGFRAAIFAPAERPAASLIQTPGIEVLAASITAARRRGLQAGLAGGLEPPDIPRLLALKPDFLVFRTSLCAGDRRDGTLDPARVAMVRDMIPRGPASEPPPQTGEGAGASTAGDKVFVRDYIVEAGIGAYRHEHRKPQRMRFNVEAELLPIPDTVADMRDVFSYDVIVDAIGLATRKHVILVERIALDVAQATLADRRVRRVRVRVEKLDIVTGSVGVEIERVR